jgi:pimeloyl-ACP methyl ester carboxylesterase
MAYFDSNGVKIHYQEFGAGDPLMLVHGFASSADATCGELCFKFLHQCEGCLHTVRWKLRAAAGGLRLAAPADAARGADRLRAPAPRPRTPP